MLLYRWLKAAASERGNEKALVYRDTYLSWRGLLHRVDRRAQELASMGLGSGAWVGLMLGNVPDFVILGLALSRIGAVVVPLDPTTGSRELDMIVDSGPFRGLITRPRGGESQGRANDVLRRPRTHVAEGRRRLQGTLLTLTVYKRLGPTPLPSEPAVVFHTLDAGGDPKGVLRTAENLTANAEQIAAGLEVTGEDRLLATVPLFSAYGFDFGLLLSLRFGATLFLEDEVSPKRVLKILRDHEVNLVPGMPTLYAALTKMPTARALKVRKPRLLAAGARLSESVADAFHARYALRLLSCYHTTEAGAICVDRRATAPTSVGKPFPGVELRIASPAGERVTIGQTGSIWVRSTAVSPGHTGLWTPTPAGKGRAAGGRESKGWYRTGDTGHIDRSGKLFLEGREDDLVKVDGKRVALGEIEGCLEQFPKVRAAQAWVIVDPLGGPMVVARVVPAGRCAAEEIIDHCARNLAPYKVPRRIEFCDCLPG